MIKQVIAIILLSIVIILCMPYVQQGLDWIVAGHDWVSHTLTNVFSGSQTGDLLRKLLALLIIPVVICLIPAVFYWFAKRSWFPYFMQIFWVTWLLEIAAIVVHYKAVAGG